MCARVLQIVPEIGYGGAEQMVVNLSNGLRERGWDVTVLVLSRMTNDAAILLAGFVSGGGRVISCDKPTGFSPRTILRVRATVRAFRPDVVHTHQHSLRYLLAATAGYSRAPRSVHTLHTPQAAQAGAIADLMHRCAFRRGVRPVAVANAIASVYEARYGYRAIPTVPNGIDMQRFAPDLHARAVWRAERGIPEDDVVIACVARLQPVKNHELLLRAFRLVVDSCERARLVLVGDGPLLTELCELARSLDLLPRVDFAGACADVERTLKGADIFTLSSKWEGHPLSLIEAMATELPAVVPRVGGIVDLIADGESGLLFAEGDCSALAAALLTLCRDAEQRRRIGSASRAAVADDCSVDAMVDRYIKIYVSTTGNGGTPGPVNHDPDCAGRMA